MSLRFKKDKKFPVGLSIVKGQEVTLDLLIHLLEMRIDSNANCEHDYGYNSCLRALIRDLKDDYLEEAGDTREAAIEESAQYVDGMCPDCKGAGWIPVSRAEHSPDCEGSCRNCPVEVQDQDQCCTEFHGISQEVRSLKEKK